MILDIALMRCFYFLWTETKEKVLIHKIIVVYIQLNYKASDIHAKQGLYQLKILIHIYNYCLLDRKINLEDGKWWLRSIKQIPVQQCIDYVENYWKIRQRYLCHKKIPSKWSCIWGIAAGFWSKSENRSRGITIFRKVYILFWMLKIVDTHWSDRYFYIFLS